MVVQVLFLFAGQMPPKQGSVLVGGLQPDLEVAGILFSVVENDSIEHGESQALIGDCVCRMRLINPVE